MASPVHDRIPADNANVAGHLTIMAQDQPHRLAIACAQWSLWPGHTHFKELSFKQLDDWSQNIAQGLLQLGIGKGTRVALLVPPGPEFFATVFALMKAGAIMICIDPGIGFRALGRCLNNAQPHAIIGSPKAHLARWMFGWGRDSNHFNIFTSASPVNFPAERCPALTLAALAAAGRERGTLVENSMQASDPAAILFTSGSTGPPKGVIYSHGNFQAQVRLLRECYDISPGEVDLSTFPLFALFAPALGMSAVIPEMDFTRPARVRPGNIINAINHYGVTSLFGSPALLQRLGRWNRQRQLTLPSLRRVLSAGAPVPASVLADLLPMLKSPACVHTPYGATEILPVTTIASDEILTQTAAETDRGKGICVGRAVPGVQIRILALHDETKTQWLGNSQTGEITVSGPNLSQGYDRNEAAQARARFTDKQGQIWHRMGDTGYLDAQLRLWFCGRVAHCVITPDRVYFPIPCEGVFNVHPDVNRCALVRLATATGIRPGLCVELEISTAASLQANIRSELLMMGEKFEHTQDIREIFFHPAFPVDIRHNAKINRGRLSKWATALAL